MIFMHSGLLYPFECEANDRCGTANIGPGIGPIPLVYGPLTYFGSSYLSLFVSLV